VVRRPALAALAATVVTTVAVVAVVAVVPAALGSALSAPAAHAAGPPAPPGAALPPDFPADVPLPPGQFQAATGGGGQWSVALLVSGSAADAHAATVAFYRAHGFVADTDSILHDAAHQVTIVVENRDHSPTRTFVAIGVGPRAAAPPGANPGSPAPSPAPAAPVSLAARLAGHGRGVATMTVAGGRVCWTIRNLHGVGRPRAATIRRGSPARPGAVVVRLGRRYRASGCTAVRATVGRSLAAAPAGFLVVVTTRARPHGAVRGRLGPA
jgi:hypothetical protein